MTMPSIEIAERALQENIGGGICEESHHAITGSDVYYVYMYNIYIYTHIDAYLYTRTHTRVLPKALKP